MSSFALSVTAATGRIRVSTETDLVRRAIAGNTHAFDELYRRHAPAAWRLGLAIAPDPAMATTAVAEGFVHALRVGRRQPVRWSIFRRMAFTWLFTLPAAALFGAGAFYGQNAIGGSAGIVVLFLVLAAYCALIYGLSRKDAVNAGNVNDAWDDGKTSAPPASIAA